MNGIDVIIPSHKFTWFGNLTNLKDYVSIEDIAIMFAVLEKLHPEYMNTASKYSYSFLGNYYNMFICKKEIFDTYCAWIFPILFECEKYIKPSPYARAKRVIGYIAEYLTPIYFIHNEYKLKFLRTQGLDGQIHNAASPRERFQAYILKNTVYRFLKREKAAAPNVVKEWLRNEEQYKNIL